MLPESSTIIIRLGVTAAALNNGDGEGVKAYTGALRYSIAKKPQSKASHGR